MSTTARWRRGVLGAVPLAALVALGAGGCAGTARSLSAGPSSRPSAHAAAATGSPATAGPATASPVGRAHQAAEREASRLLALLVPPPGAIRERTEPGLSEPFSRPVDSNVIDDAAVWLVPLTFAQALSYVQSHPPAGLTQAGSGSESGPGQSLDETTYDAPSAAAWEQATAVWEVAALPQGRVGLRADGSDIWINPTPMRDTQPGPRVRVTSTAACPASLHDVSNPGQNLGEQMVPRATPTGGVACWYGSGGAVRRVLTVGQARAVEAAARGLSLGTTGTYTTSCPAMIGPGQTALVALAYAGRPEVDLYWAAEGCPFVDNGQITARGALGLAVPGQ